MQYFETCISFSLQLQIKQGHFFPQFIVYIQIIFNDPVYFQSASCKY